MTKKKVVIVGNCQARPLSELLKMMSNKIEVLDVIIVHLSKASDFLKYKSSLDQADYIISQKIADNYPCDFVRTKFLKEEYPNKLVTIINLYYSGYNPDWGYMRVPNFGVLRGAMGDYQNKTIFNAWKQGKSVEESVFSLTSKLFNKKYSGVSEKSILEMTNREKECDVKIVDYIKKRYLNQRLFFTFNHPNVSLLKAYSIAILDFLCIEKNSLDIDIPERLNQFIPLVNPIVDNLYDKSKQHKGVSYILLNDGVKISNSKSYTNNELVLSFYEVYEHFSEALALKDYEFE